LPDRPEKYQQQERIMSDKAPAWVPPVMRAGYYARAATYAIVGGLAVYAVAYGGEAEGTTDAIAELSGQPMGLLAMLLIALGMLAYMVWRFVDAALDLENHGTSAKGLVARSALVITGLIHGAIGLSVATAAIGYRSGGSSGSGSGGTQTATQKLMSLPYGPLLVGLVGLATIGAGIYYMHKGWAEKYKEHIRVTRTTRRLDPVLKFGCLAEGVVVALIGVSICVAALHTNPSEAGGVGEALSQLRAMSFGRLLLAVTGLGLIAFAVENAIEGTYRILPRYAGSDVMTLARRAKLKAEGKLRAATA
jgi:hypothetical protein